MTHGDLVAQCTGLVAATWTDAHGPLGLEGGFQNLPSHSVRVEKHDVNCFTEALLPASSIAFLFHLPRTRRIGSSGCSLCQHSNAITRKIEAGKTAP